MKTIAEFETFYNTALLPYLQPLELRRQRIFHTLTGIVAGLLAIGAVAFCVFQPDVRNQPQTLIIPGVAAAGIMAISWYLLTRNFVQDFKREVIGQIVKFCDPTLTYAPEGLIPRQQFETARIFTHSIDRFAGEDLVQGKIGATTAAFSEVHAEYKTTTTDSKGRTRTQWHTIFKGLFFVGDFNKNFQGVTVVLPDVAQKFLGFIGQKLQEMNLARLGQLVKLEDPEFEKEFVVYADDQVEARYILSTSLMKRICDYKRKTGKPIYLSFVDSNIYVAVHTGTNLFEPRIFRTLLDFALAREYLEQLLLAVGIVDDLNLNTRIWTKS